MELPNPEAEYLGQGTGNKFEETVNPHTSCLHLLQTWDTTTKTGLSLATYCLNVKGRRFQRWFVKWKKKSPVCHISSSGGSSEAEPLYSGWLKIATSSPCFTCTCCVSKYTTYRGGCRSFLLAVVGQFCLACPRTAHPCSTPEKYSQAISKLSPLFTIAHTTGNTLYTLKCAFLTI